MKKILLPFLSLTGLGFSALAQSHINIELLSATYTAPAVQFRVSWNSIPAADGETHHSKIWLWVDFRKIENNQPSGTWTRATVSSPSPGTVAPETTKGFWLQGNSGSYSQIVTVALPDIPANTKFNWCAYASDCPPNVTVTNGTYTFKGTPPFTLIASDGTTTQTVTGTTLAASALTVTPTTIRDKTECPGVFCIYTGNDLYIDVDHLCQQRTGGAKNWEAYIKDIRDNHVYRIVQMPTNTWWMAEDLMWDGKPSPSATGYTIRGYARSCGTHYGCGRFYAATALGHGIYAGDANSRGASDVCPTAWAIPSVNELCPYANSTDSPQPYLGSDEFGGPDTYGLSLWLCGTSGWTCGTAHTSYPGGFGGCFRFYRNTRVGENGCGEQSTAGGRNVRCVRDL
ncbi:MAG: hypothetical protein LBG31_00445 [Prevotellaceae bacterium]|jgi:hypothetical protein|nr:hypothetical protein [Prevotellaceae bacterium]